MKNKTLSIIDSIVLVLASIILVALMVSAAVLPIAKSKNYYMKEHNKNNVVEILKEDTFNGISHFHRINDERVQCYYPIYDVTWTDVENATEHIINYLYNQDVESMQFTVTTSEGEVEFFSSQAISHMKDVKVLFIGGIHLTYIAIILFILCCIYLIWRRNTVKNKIFKTYLVTVIIMICFTLCLVVFAASNFDLAFDVFHKVIFPDASKYEEAITFTFCDTLTNVLTGEFFMHIGLTIGIIFITLLSLSIILMILAKKYLPIILSKYQKEKTIS